MGERVVELDKQLLDKQSIIEAQRCNIREKQILIDCLLDELKKGRKGVVVAVICDRCKKEYQDEMRI